MANLTSVLKYLEQERNRLGAQLKHLNHALSVLVGTSDHRGRRTISAAGRARIAAAQRARWAKVKGQKVVSIVSRKGHAISPAARKRIVAAQKARWAKWRKAQAKT
jgi:predicted RNA-binding protein with PIN domain